MEEHLPLLFARLTWPSGMVRERASVSIAELLTDPCYAKGIQERLFRWLRDQRLESVAAIGLLVLLQAKIQDSSFVSQRPKDIASAVSAPSILSWLLTKELVSDSFSHPDWAALNSGPAPTEFEPDAFFSKYSTNFLPPWFIDRAEDLQATKHIPFVKQWSFEWQGILERTGNQLSLDPLHFQGRQDSDHYAAIDFQLSEVYRSAYLRALAWAAMIGRLSESEASLLAIETCPIDLGLWQVKPASMPSWWPEVHEEDGRIDSTAARIWRQIDALWEQQQASDDDWIIAEASGQAYEGAAVYDLEIFGLFQVCQGPSAPDLEEIAKWYRWENHVEYLPCGLRFEGIVRPVGADFISRDFGDWSVVPAACSVRPCAIPRWQFWRMFRRIWLPAPFLGANPLGFGCSDEALTIRDGEEIVGVWSDWTDTLREKMKANLPPSTGQSLLVKRGRIQAFERKTRSAFCWVCCLTGYHREYDYQPYKEFHDRREYGARKVVVP